MTRDAAPSEATTEPDGDRGAIGDSGLANWPLRRIVGIPVIVGAIARILYWILVTPNWVPNSDADQYLQIARNLAAGDGYSLVFPQLELHATAFRPPVYPILLAVPTWILGDEVLWPARLLSLLLGLGVIAAAVTLANRWGGAVAGLSTGLLVALYPPLIANDTVTLTEPVALLILLGVLITLDKRHVTMCGLLSGVLLLTRPNAYLVVIIAAIALWRTVGVKRAGAYVGISVLVLVPWVVRNQVQVGTPRLTTSEGFNISAIYSPESQRLGGFVDPVFDPAYAGTELRFAQFDEAYWNQRLTDYGLDALRENPTYLFEVIFRNLRSYLELTPSANESPETLDGRNMTFRAWTLPLFYLVTIAGIGGLWIHRRNAALWPALLIVAQFAALSLVLVAPPRLRAPFDLLMCIGAGLLVAWAVARRDRGTGPQGASGASDDDLHASTGK